MIIDNFVGVSLLVLAFLQPLAVDKRQFLFHRRPDLFNSYLACYKLSLDWVRFSDKRVNRLLGSLNLTTNNKPTKVNLFQHWSIIGVVYKVEQTTPISSLGTHT